MNFRSSIFAALSAATLLAFSSATPIPTLLRVSQSQTKDQTCKNIAVPGTACTIEVTVKVIPTPVDVTCQEGVKYVQISGKISCPSSGCGFEFEQCGDSHAPVTFKCDNVQYNLDPGPNSDGKWGDHATGNAKCSWITVTTTP